LLIEPKETNMIQSKIGPAPSDLLPAVIEAVVEAGGLIRKEFHRQGGPRGEGGTAPIDEEVENLLKDKLRSFHHCGWLGEETGEDIAISDDIWIVDPHDGTSDFLAGHRGSAVSVALVRRGIPVLGVIYAPVAPDDRGDLVAWAQGTRLTRNGSPVSRSRQWSHLVVALNVDAANYALHNHTSLKGLRVRAIPSPAYRLALAAVGEVDAAISLMWGLEPWDFAGGHALILGSGGVFVDLVGEAVDYRTGAINGCIGGPEDLVEMIASMAPGGGQKEKRLTVRPRRRISDPNILSRAQGALLGQLAGDALGSAVEFCSAAEIAHSHPNGVTQLEDGGTWNLIAGQPTDDSEMALALARELIRRGRFDEAGIADAYVEWYRSKPFDIGTTTTRGIQALAAGKRSSSESESNGALMRVSPVGIFAAGEPKKAAQFAATDARLTHPSPVCQAASAAYAAAIAVAIQGGGIDDIWTAAHEHAGDLIGSEAVRERLVAARTNVPSDFQHQMGWVLTAFQNAFYWLLSGADLADAVIQTVGHGGDTDTNAAVCGALLGAAQGRDAVPLQWRNAVLTCRPVRAPDIYHPRPSTYWPDDALELAEALIAAGKA
jgi:ADP-ribosylglycohydrolase/fructose-1,6-bisphosphatase/inositol monophosphatase family enzyme